MERKLKRNRNSYRNIQDINLRVFITHFVPPKLTIYKQVRDFTRPRFTREYIRSWARLLKHGTRGNMTWKKDIMTQIRRDANRNRLFHLHNTLLYLAKIPSASLEVYIHTNSHRHAAIIRRNWDKFNVKVMVHDEFRDMNVLNNSPWIVDDKSNPWLLTWKHKSSLSACVARGPDNSIYVCMEDDVIFTVDNLTYFLNFKDELKNFGLLPSFLRTEWSYVNDQFVAIDHLAKVELNTRELPKKKVDNRIFVELPNPYSGIIVLDQELAEEYLLSPASNELESRALTWWDIGARSAMGLQFVNVPKGFNSRNVVLVDKQKTGIDVSAWIAHQPNIYAQRIDFREGITPFNLASKK